MTCIAKSIRHIRLLVLEDKTIPFRKFNPVQENNGPVWYIPVGKIDQVYSQAGNDVESDPLLYH